MSHTQWFSAVLIGVALGLAVGWTAQFLPVVPLLRSVGAFVVALALGNVAVLFWWRRRKRESGYYGFGLDNVAYLAIAFVVAAVLHSILGRLGAVWTPAVGSYRPIVLGGVGALWGTIQTVWALTALERATRVTGGT